MRVNFYHITQYLFFIMYFAEECLLMASFDKNMSLYFLYHNAMCYPRYILPFIERSFV